MNGKQHRQFLSLSQDRKALFIKRAEASNKFSAETMFWLKLGLTVSNPSMNKAMHMVIEERNQLATA